MQVGSHQGIAALGMRGCDPAHPLLLALADLSIAPYFVISPSGAVSQLATGQPSVDQLIAKLNAAAGA